ncbi:MAG TPA: hypothetical protein VFG24_04025 [Nitrosopumilaceae archaeon]|nr:hypothetical protein [Nitrosopumilaceae archaeon]
MVSIGWILEINSNLQSEIEKLGDDLHQKSEISKSLESELNSTNLLLDNQRVKIEQLESNVTLIKEIEISSLLELQNKISDIQANIISTNNNTESLNKRVGNLEEKINASTSIVPNQFQFETITLSDENNKNWTSNYIKENLYDVKIKSICNSPTSHCFAHLSKLNTLVGTAIAIDTIGSSDSGYYFMGYSDEYVTPADGVVKVSGKFLKKDDLILTDLGKNSTLSMFILGENPDLVINKTTLLDYNHTNGVWFSKEVEFKLDPGKIFRIGFGGTDSWIQDEKMYDSWAGVSINAEAKR